MVSDDSFLIKLFFLPVFLELPAFLGLPALVAFPLLLSLPSKPPPEMEAPIKMLSTAWMTPLQPTTLEEKYPSVVWVREKRVPVGCDVNSVVENKSTGTPIVGCSDSMVFPPPICFGLETSPLHLVLLNCCEASML